MTNTRNGFDLPALDAALGPVLKRAVAAGRPPVAVALAVLARASSVNASVGHVQVWLRSRGNAGVKSLASDTSAWRAVTASAKRWRESSSPGGADVRLRVARRGVAALLRGLPTGEAALVAVLTLGMLDDENQWDSALVSRKLSVSLGAGHSTIQGRVRKLDGAGVLTLLSKGRGVPGRVRFAPLPKSVDALFGEYPLARALVDALVSGEETDAVRVLRSVASPALHYGERALTPDAWLYSLLSLLDAESVVSASRVSRARTTLRKAGVTADTFADAVVDLSDGEPTALRDDAERARVAIARERTESAENARALKSKLYEQSLPALYAHCGQPPRYPVGTKSAKRAQTWIAAMTSACASASARPEVAKALRTALRSALGRRGWSGEHLAQAIDRIVPEGTDTPKEAA